jgi:hypothetical protein
MGTLYWCFRAVSQQLLFSKEVRDDSVSDTPTNKVQLGTGCLQALELDALCATEGVEELLRIPVQTRLVGHMDREQLAVRSRVCHLLHLGVVGHKPLEFAERYTLSVLQNINKLILIFWLIKETLQTREQKRRLVH